MRREYSAPQRPQCRLKVDIQRAYFNGKCADRTDKRDEVGCVDHWV